MRFKVFVGEVLAPPTPTTQKPWCPWKPCGPGGKPCVGCPRRGQLCMELISQLEAIERKIRRCVCGEKVWLLR
ncbi:uncharacterized protein Dvir_GJ27025 [Drosophila virilis]|uniref:Uncharacterized protein n=1 Tax=Drosophila virilis TaxID=7244 RepID=A0A0Q9WPR4_DROVI|nr:uncharacterized protein Dvir_GJ27025 [Drosophila virilis]